MVRCSLLATVIHLAVVLALRFCRHHQWYFSWSQQYDTSSDGAACQKQVCSTLCVYATVFIVCTLLTYSVM
jgi:hypothetical protein